MAMPVQIIMTSAIAAHTPITLCQLKSRAFPVIPGRRSRTARKWRHVQCRGSQRYSPKTAREQEHAVGRVHGCPESRPRAAIRTQPPVPRANCTEERVRPRRGLPDDRTGVSIGVHRAELLTQIHLNRPVLTGKYGHVLGVKALGR